VAPCSRSRTGIPAVISASARRSDLELVRLATYRHVNPANGDGTRVGFIIDDSPDIAAVDASGGRIDLYAYTSMAVAALQQQAREIAALRREVARLKRRLR
jgi:hypothetical protein